MASESEARLLVRCEALIDGKKINEAIDLLNRLGTPRAAFDYLVYE